MKILKILVLIFVLVVSTTSNGTIVQASSKNSTVEVVSYEEFETEISARIKNVEKNEMNEKQLKEMYDAFSEKNVGEAMDKAYAELSRGKTGRVVVPINDEYSIFVSFASEPTANNDVISERSLRSTTEYITHQGHVGGLNSFGSTVWELYTTGYFMYDGSLVGIVDADCWGYTYGIGWSCGGFESTPVQVSNTRAYAKGEGDFTLTIGIDPVDMVIRDYHELIKVFCDEDGNGWY